MITGAINSKIEAVISLEVFEAQGKLRAFEAILDTGYSGYLTLSAEDVKAFGLHSIGSEQLMLADGTEVTAAICPATVVWDGQPRPIEIDILETSPLVGMALMKGYELNARIVEGGTVTLTACEHGALSVNLLI